MKYKNKNAPSKNLSMHCGSFHSIDVLCDLLIFSLHYLASIPPVKGFSVNEDYYNLWTVHSFNMETFEFSVPTELVLMTWSVYKIFLSSEYAISKQRAVKIDHGWASVKTDPTFTTK